MPGTRTLNPEIAATLTVSDLPEGLTKWLGRLQLLLGVPFADLVSDERLLPPESIKFFRLDPSWVGALTDGALSIGRHYTGSDAVSPSLVAEQVHQPRLHAAARSQMAEIRRAQIKNAPDRGPANLTGIVTGFVLRSKVVAAWKSMDVMGYREGASPFDYQEGKISSEQVQPLDILRLETLSPTVLFGLFCGQLYQLVLHQPPEAIHFGFQSVDPGANRAAKDLRTPTSGWDDPDTKYDTQALRSQELNNVFVDGAHRVLNMLALSQTLAQKLNAVKKAPGYFENPPDPNHKDHLLSSDFALEMVQGVGLVSFIYQVPEKQ